MKNLKRVFISFIYLFLLLSLAHGQYPTVCDFPPKTKLGALEAKIGSVVIKSHSGVGHVDGETGGEVIVESLEYRDVGTGQKAYGIAIRLRKPGQVEEGHTSYVDYDEIDALIKGVDYIDKLDSSGSQLPRFEGQYRTKDDLEIATFNDERGVLRAAVSSGLIENVTVIMRLENLQKLKELIVYAKTRLDSARQ